METKWIRIDDADDGQMYVTTIIAKDIAGLARWFYFIEVVTGPVTIVRRRLLPSEIAINLTISTEYGFRPVAVRGHRE